VCEFSLRDSRYRIDRSCDQINPLNSLTMILYMYGAQIPLQTTLHNGMVEASPSLENIVSTVPIVNSHPVWIT
jgi:hypothetical protein